MSEETFFTTQFNEKIRIIHGYAQRIGRTQKLTSEMLKNCTTRPNTSGRIDLKYFSKDLITYALLMDMLESVGLLSKDGYERALDIGGQGGIHASLFRAQHAKYVCSVDLADCYDKDLTKKMRTIIRNQRMHKYKEYLYHDCPITAPVLQKYFPGKMSRRFYTMCCSVPSKKQYYNFNFKRELTVDKFVVGDFVDTITEKYDIILSFLTLCLIPYSRVVKKVASLLPPGGVFAFLERHTHGPGILTPLSGDFPYFEKRLTLSDIKRYYQQYKPDELRYVDDAYNIYDSERTTIEQYITLSRDCGLRLVAFRPLVMPFLSDTIYSYYSHEPFIKPPLSDEEYIDEKEILRDIQHFHKDVSLSDLHTSLIMFAFKKI